MKIFETIEAFIKGIAYFSVICITAIAGLFTLYFVGMTAIRLAQLLWKLIFSHRWEF
jgi:hypothetical protein